PTNGVMGTSPAKQSEVYVQEGEEKRLAGDYSGAIADFNVALQLDPKDFSTDAVALRGRGYAKMMLRDFAGAIDDFNVALELDPKDAFALSRRGAAKRKLGDLSRAIADFNVALELDPKDAFALSRRGDAKRQQGDFAGAMADLDLAFQMEQQDAFAWWCRDRVIKDLLTGLAGEQLKWAVVGAGPVGLVLAMSMAVSMLLQGRDATVARIDVYESRWIEWSQADAKWRRLPVFANFWPLFFCNHHGSFTWYGLLFVSVTIFV
ncbi:MAG: tetratricopeptide repeat protein, partial [Cohaesibacter sp.]|nr:tetratricopeptide repeat protein [Cohaesibacter sp.]